jgi:plastocyanin
MSQRPASRLARILVTASCLSLAGAGVAVSADETVVIDAFAYVPATVTVQVGDTVTWRNDDSVAHTATADDGSFDTGALATGESGAETFQAAGTFDYHCSIHPQITGTVVVEAGAPAPTDTPAPTDAPAPTGTAGPTDAQPTQPHTDAEPAGPAGTSTTGGVVLLLAAAAGLAALWSSLLLERRRSR